MPSALLTRRRFLSAAAVSGVALAFPWSGCSRAAGTDLSKKIGCFNRPWNQWGFDAALQGIQAAGYRWAGLLTPPKGDHFARSEATPEYLAALKQKVARHQLQMEVASIQFKNALPVAEAIADVRRQLDHAQTLGLRLMLSTGASKPEHYAPYYQVMAAAAAYGQDRGIQLAVKPHGGVSAAAAEMQRCLEEVNHPNFKIWYDAGNILYYTGKDPVEELRPIASHVVGFSAKDCAGEKSDVMIQFGIGRVDFAAVFRTLKAAGFAGPIIVEGCRIGADADATTAYAQANREFLEAVLAKI